MCETTFRAALTSCSLAPTLSLVLLSHSSSNYLSLYPYARARWGLTCPVYATQPTVEMGRVVCLAEAESWRSECPVESEGEVAGDGGSKEPFKGPFVPTVEEIHEAFDWIKAVRYSQPLHLGGQYFKSLQRKQVLICYYVIQAIFHIFFSPLLPLGIPLVEVFSKYDPPRQVRFSTPLASIIPAKDIWMGW